MYLGVDVGGTSFKAGLVDEGLRMIDTETCEAAKDAADYGAYLAQSMAGLCRRLLDRNAAWDKVSCVGAGIPGFVDPEDGMTILDAVHLGDRTAVGLWRSYLHYLAEGILSGINAFQPELVCIGGGIGNASEEDLLRPLQRAVEGRSLARGSRKQPKLVKARLGNEAGIIGAALLGK